MNYVQMLTRYNAWANGLFLPAVSKLPAAELEAARPIVFGSLIRTLNHAYAMDFVWQCHLLGKAHGLVTRNPEAHPGIKALIDLQTEMDRWYVGYADSITERGLLEIVDFEFIGGGRGAMSRRDILLHVVNHTTYHRGHAADMLYQMGVEPPTTDLPVFLREHPDGV